MSHAPRTTTDASSRPDRPRRRSASRAAGAPTPRPESAANTQRSREARHADNRRDDNRRPSAPAPDAAPLVAIEPSGPAVTSFAKLGVPAPLVSCLAAQGIDSAFPIQSATLPDSLAGRDVLGRGRTGSGKTIAFALPLVARLAATGRRTRPGHPRALVLLPTRELATQVYETIAPLAKAMGLTTTTVFGGVSQSRQVSAMRNGVDIVVACPGRLEDLLNQRHVRLDDIEVTVLDEADHMADLGFLPGVKRLLDKTPTDGQRLLFSATLDNGVDVLVRRYLVNPVTHSVDSDASTEPDMEHHVFTVEANDKNDVVHELASGEGRSLLFTRTKHGAKKLARQLTQAGVPAVDLHGNLAQNARDRNLEAFRSGSVRVLVATDIAARGIHVDDVDARRPRRPAGRAQGLPAPLGPHRARRRCRRRRDRGHRRAAQRRRAPRPQGRDPADRGAGASRRPGDQRADRSEGGVRDPGCSRWPSPRRASARRAAALAVARRPPRGARAAARAAAAAASAARASREAVRAASPSTRRERATDPVARSFVRVAGFARRRASVEVPRSGAARGR